MQNHSEKLVSVRRAIVETADEHGISKLAEVGNHLREQGVDYKGWGYPKLTMLLQEFTEYLSLWQDKAFFPPVTLVRWNGNESGDESIGQSVTDSANEAIGEVMISTSDPGSEAMRVSSSEATSEVMTLSSNEAGTIEEVVQKEEVTVAEPVAGIVRKYPSRMIGHPGNELTRWAYLVHIPTMLGQLSTMAQPEVWTLPGSTDDDYGILMNYLKYTFVRLRREGKVLEDFENGMAAFNTGLVDRRYEPIHALFEPNPNGAFQQKWRLHGFCIAGEDAIGKRLVAAFNPLPEPPSYFRSLHDMFYDIGMPEPIMDYEHILLENVERLPKDFLLEYCNDDELKRYIRSTPYEAGMSAVLYHEELSDRIRKDMRFYRRLIGRFRESVSLALKRVRWNYKTAIPMYYPTRNIMSLLLPLSLVEDELADVALVVERLENGNYLGHTILTLQMAYNNARLVCRLESDWLRVGAERFGVFPEL